MFSITQQLLTEYAKPDSSCSIWWHNSLNIKVDKGCIPGGVLRYISDRDVRSPFLGLKLAI